MPYIYLSRSWDVICDSLCACPWYPRHRISPNAGLRVCACGRYITLLDQFYVLCVQINTV